MVKKKKKKRPSKAKTRAPVLPTLSDEIFTDREDVLTLLREKALDAKTGMSRSTLLIGHRRVGKTEVLKRLYNELFCKQEEVVPIYICLDELGRATEGFASEYLRTFLGQYVGFKLKRPQVTMEITGSLDATKSLIGTRRNEGLRHIANEYELAVKEQRVEEQLLLAISSPKLISDINREPIFVMLDGFQHVIEIRNKDATDPDLLGKYQAAVESHYCPHLVTGAPVTLLTIDITGKGPLHGRFHTEYIRGLDDHYAPALVEKLGKRYDVLTNRKMAGELARRTGGNPFYIDCTFGGARRERKNLDNIDDVDEVIAYELTQGAIWLHFYCQLNYYFNNISEKGVTKNIFYFASRYRDERIDPKQIAEKMSHWGVREEDAQEVLFALSRADLIEERADGAEFYNVKGPMLRELTDAWARVDVESSTWEEAGMGLIERYRDLSLPMTKKGRAK